MRSIIAYATNLFQKGATEVILKAMGLAINKTVTIAEIIKRRITGLHQNTIIDSTDIIEVWEPLEEGLENVETTRHVSSIQITLSTQALDENSSGYQPPLPEDQVKTMSPINDNRPVRGAQGRGGRGRYRGYRRGGPPQVLPRNQPNQQVGQEPNEQEQLQGNFEGSGRARNRFFNRNRGQVGQFAAPPLNNQPRGRGRGRRGRARGGRGRGQAQGQDYSTVPPIPPAQQQSSFGDPTQAQS